MIDVDIIRVDRLVNLASFVEEGLTDYKKAYNWIKAASMVGESLSERSMRLMLLALQGRLDRVQESIQDISHGVEAEHRTLSTIL